MSRGTLPAHEHARAILVVDSKRRLSYRNFARREDESIEESAERLKREYIDLLTKVNS